MIKPDTIQEAIMFMRTRGILTILFGLALIPGCGGGGGGSAPIPVIPAVNVAADALPQPDDFRIRLHYTRSLDPATLVLGGDLAAESDGGTFRSDHSADDGIDIGPATRWSAGVGRTLEVRVSDTAGNPLPVRRIHLDIAPGTRYYVDASRPDDSVDGLSPATAKRTIRAAIAAAVATGTPAVILVAGGDYPVTWGVDHVVLAEGVSLFGGCAPDFSARDPRRWLSTIRDTHDGTGSNYLDPARAVEAGAGISRQTVFDGFQVLSTSTSASGETAAAVHVHSGGSPYLGHNHLVGGRGERSNGLSIRDAGSSPLIVGNRIESGTGSSWAFGIYSLNANPVIRNNLISGNGTGTISAGISFQGGAIIRNNTIHGGSGGMYSHGITFSSITTQSVIENNLIFTTGGQHRICLGDSNDTMIDRLRNNDLFDCPTALFMDIGGGRLNNCPFVSNTDCHTDPAVLNDPAIFTAGTPGATAGNVSAPVSFIDRDGSDGLAATLWDNDWRLEGTGVPCRVSRGGLDGQAENPPWAFANDAGSARRTAPWSMGAFEYDGNCQ